MRIIKTTILFLILLQLTTARAQVWIGALPTYYNPSFAGSTDKIRLSSYFSYRKNNLYDGTKEYLGYQGISADAFIPRISTGIGINISYFSTRAIQTYSSPGHSMEAELIAAPKISVRGKYTISPSVSLNYLLNNSRYGSPIWDNKSGLNNISRLHSRLGIMVQNKKFYMGYSTEFENNPISPWRIDNLAYYESRKSLRVDIPQNYYFNYSMVQTGYSYCLSDKRKLSVTPQVVWIFSHGIFNRKQLAPYTANFTLRTNNLLAGVGYNQVFPNYFSKANYTFMLGYQSEKFRLMLTRDFQPTRTYELLNDFHLSLRYLIGIKNNNPSLTE